MKRFVSACVGVVTLFAPLALAHPPVKIESAGVPALLDDPVDAAVGATVPRWPLAPQQWAEALDGQDILHPVLWRHIATIALGRASFAVVGHRDGVPELQVRLTGLEGAEVAIRQLARGLRESSTAVSDADANGVRSIIDAELGFVLEDDELVFLSGLGQPVDDAITPLAPLPRGAASLFVAHVDLGRLIEMFGSEIDQGDAELLESLENAGLLAEPSIALEIQLGRAPDHVIGRGITRGFLPFAERIGFTSQGLDPNVLDVVPHDATSVQAVAFEPGAAAQAIVEALRANGVSEDPMAMVTAILGFDPQTELFQQLGPSIVYYTSLETGGGGVLSSVVVADVRDADRFWQALDQLASILTGLGAGPARGFVAVRPMELADGTPALALETPWIPVPAEVCIAVSNNRVVAALSPEALEHAIEHISRTGRPFRTRGDVNLALTRSVADARGGTLAYFSWTDDRFSAQRSYSLYRAAVSAARNLAGGPTQLDSLARPVSYTDYVDTATESIAIAHWRGDDLVVWYDGDPSVVRTLANMQSRAGAFGLSSPSFITMQVGILLPALGRVRVNAHTTLSTNNQRKALAAAMNYAVDHNDTLPPDLHTLIELGYLGDTHVLESPAGPAIDGGPDYAFRGGGRLSGVAAPGRFVVIVDRAVILRGRSTVPVGFLDGHVEEMLIEDLVMLLAEPENQEFAGAVGLVP
ncbi:MAG: hypothetical protein AAGI30_14165 [Planctomycetota bacterium]